jgi:ribosomal protein S18 acetylase RimI-like enzyme
MQNIQNNKLQELKLDYAFPGHAWEISRLVNSVYRGENSKKGWTTEADLLEGIRITVNKILELIGKKNNEILLAVTDDKIIGCVHLEKINKKCHLGMLSVDVNYQKEGIGKYLMNESEKYAKEVFRCGEMEMKVIGQRKELIEYYIRQGYKLMGEKENFSLNTHFGAPKRNDLYFEYMVKPI